MTDLSLDPGEQLSQTTVSEQQEGEKIHMEQEMSAQPKFDQVAIIPEELPERFLSLK